MSTTPPAVIPVHIELDRENQRLLVRWADGHESPLGWEYLRWRCPCAECSGEGNMPGVLSSLPMFKPGQTVMTDINLTGRYGVTPEWADGHSLGIYTFRMLRAICPCTECVEARGGEAPKGRGDW
ncbi:MAG: gamma-butyrobetaine hydroxylase-like domain-containing protein [Chloroflexota bacterium]